MLTQSLNKFLFLPTCKGVEVICLSSIIRVEAISNYSKLYLTDGKTLVIAKTLGRVAEQLPSDPFIRIHRTHIVNKNFVNPMLQGKMAVAGLPGGEQIVVAKRKKEYFLHYWSDAIAS